MAKGSSLLRDVVARCASWEDFVRQLKKKSDKEKGDIFEHLVRAYLQLDPEYATKLRKVWLLDDVPSALRKKLHLPASDQGIDLIAETNTGEYWAIQCKYREDTARPLTWRGDLSTFAGLAFGLCKNISFGLVCSTTERITSVLKHRERIGFCALDVWQGLDKEFFDRLRKLLGHKPTKLVPLKPRPHQKKAIADARRHFVGKKQKRGKLISPCGSGKSLTAYWIARDLKAKKIVVAVPSLALIRQTLKVWLRESMAHGDTVEWICVCSDESAGRVEQDDVAVLRQDLGVPCLTDPKEIASWLKQKKPGLTVVFTTYQSGEALGKAARRAKFTFDLGIMDEAHKTVGDGDKLFSHLLHDKNLTIRRRIFMTATERRYRGKGDKILSMDNAAIYGDTFHLLSFKRALEAKPAILSDYRIVTILVSREEVAELIRKNVFVKPDKGRWTKEIEAEMLAGLVALRKAMRQYPIRHAVSFHSSIQRAEVFKEHNDAYSRAFRKHGAMETFHVSGQTPTGTRARMVKEFAESDRALITNARCLTEGVDVPDIDCVMFADPRRSAVDIVQAVGRALRPTKGKKMGYVIVPILHDAKAKPDGVFDSKEFQEILTTLRALAANDDRIIEHFRSISEGKRSGKGGSVVFEMDERFAKRIDFARFAEEIEIRCWNRLAKLSWRTFQEAREFARSLGLRSAAEWFTFTKSRPPATKLLPADIPVNPMEVYSAKGWRGMGDWLGTGTIAPRLRAYRPFTQARTFVRRLKLESVAEWIAYVKGIDRSKPSLPPDIPATPERTYRRSGWNGYGDWLGTGTIATFNKQYRSFASARQFVHKLKLRSQKEWRAYCKGDTASFRRKLPRVPKDIPLTPERAYRRNGWNGYGDWLGNGSKQKKERLKDYRPFRDAVVFARGLKLHTKEEWREFCNSASAGLPIDIPAFPERVYKDRGWRSYEHWLGSSPKFRRKKEIRQFAKARAFARKLKLKSGAEWSRYCQGHFTSKPQLPADIPLTPRFAYAKIGWISMGDWLGTGYVATRKKQYWPFRKARSFVRKLNLQNWEDWSAYCKGLRPEKGLLPDEIPRSPRNAYLRSGWRGFGDWLGTGRIANFERRFRPFIEARAFARSLKLRTGKEWRAFCKGQMSHLGTLPVDIPSDPRRSYGKNGWVGMGDWLGTDRKRKTKRRR